MESSALSEESNLNFAVDQTENCVYEKLVASGGSQADLKQLRQPECTASHADFRYESSAFPCNEHQSLTTECDPNVKAKIYYDDQSKENDYQGEMDELHGNYFHKSSFQYKTQTLHSERATEVSAHPQESPLVADTKQAEEIQGKLELYCPNTIFKAQKVKDADSKKSQHEFAKSICSVTEEKGTYHQTGKLISYPRSPQYQNEARNESFISSGNSPYKSIKLDMPHSVPQSPQSSLRQSTSPATKGEMSVLPERSPLLDHSLSGHRPASLLKGAQDMLYSPVSHRQRITSSPERSAVGKEIPSHAVSTFPHKSGRRSPHKSRRRSPQEDDSSRKQKSPPRSHHSPEDHRQRSRLVSRSPTRQKDSSFGYGSGDHDGSHSRSPYKRDHHRSSRRRYSPRGRSPQEHYSRRPSPRRRPWSPPPNRRTGIGKPGKNLFVAGFSFLTTERDLERKFSRYGRVRDVRIVRDKRSGDSRGFGFLSLERDEDADAAIRALDETEWNGRIILVEKTTSARR